jgi:hypothetical protein
VRTLQAFDSQVINHLVATSNLARPACWMLRQSAEYQSAEIIVHNLGALVEAGNTKGGSITVLLTSCLTGLD